MSKEERRETAAQRRVPAEEMPFNVPANWRWCDLGEVCTIKTGKLDANAAVENGPYPFFTCSQHASRIDTFAFEGESILIAGNGLFNVKYYDGKFNAYQRTYVLQNFSVSAKYLYYYITYTLSDITKGQRGSTIKYIRLSDLTDHKVCIPPLPEQKRIVERIESLLGKLDEAKQMIGQARETSAQRCATILIQAYKGELTESWRKEHASVLAEDECADQLPERGAKPLSLPPPYTLPEGWKWFDFHQVADIVSNLVDPALYPDFPHIAPDNIEKGSGALLEYGTIEEAGVKSPKHYFSRGHILYSKIRPYLSKVVIADFDGLCSADMYPIHSKINTQYLFRYMLSNVFLHFATTSGSRTVLPKINQKGLNRIPVPVPHPEEQKEIVRMIEHLFEKEEQILQLAKDAETHLETMKQAILHKAFRSELGTYDAEEKALECV
ncbi:restriction endonuclease subunit S [Aneurinibacillus sp. BA2021]|nr:restriction endonuclease subunit S [Aneurinibacillus sp. BA2021]